VDEKPPPSPKQDQHQTETTKPPATESGEAFRQDEERAGKEEEGEVKKIEVPERDIAYQVINSGEFPGKWMNSGEIRLEVGKLIFKGNHSGNL
jgi:hypothetical protein